MPNKNGKGNTQRGRTFGSQECTCPKCGYKEDHLRGVPCSTKNCPKCKSSLRGVNCL